jgi:hypothetical protein
MIESWKAAIWSQFGASIQMLENAINECPDEVWGDRAGFHEFWYMAYHTLFWLDFYFSGSTEQDFKPLAPYTTSEFDPAGAFPDRIYTRQELLQYLEYNRSNCRKRIAAFTEETMHQDSGIKERNLTNAELILYNLRHVQHHTAQLNLLLRQSIDSAPRWVSKPKIGLSD